MKSPLLIRQWDILNPERIRDIAIIGAGGIGSTTAFLLAKMGFPNIRVYDFDTVGEENVASQMYRIKDIGKPKVEALKEIIEEASGIIIRAHNEKVEKIKAQVVILTVDDIKTREILARDSKYELCLDGRMGAETFNIYSFLDGEQELYLKTIFPKGEAANLPCTAKAIAYNTFGIGSLLANMVKKYANAEELPFEQSFCYKNLLYFLTPIENWEKFNL